MTIRLSNTLTGVKEDFIPADPNRVLMYVCGPTVYNYIHIGNARPIVIFDLLYRLLKQHYKEVVYARNITDVDDKIINAASSENVTVDELSQRYINAFHQDIAKLNILTPSAEPRATEYIPEMIKMIEKLLSKGYAYEAEGQVLFEIAKAKNYGCLSHQSMDDIIEGARVEIAPYKKNPSDFVLWKPSQPEQIGWDSPWGRGRPGWHLECSVMIETLLGDTIDIHGGGMDLIFPHHENEIAQSECAHGKQFVRYWLHNGYITIKGDKMAKSVGNFISLREILENFSGECVRLALMSVHYKKPLDWTADTLEQAGNSLDKWYRLLRSAQLYDVAIDNKVVDALADDLNTPQAIAELHRLASETSLASGSEYNNKASVLKASANFIGLLNEQPDAWFQKQSSAKTTATQISEQEVEHLIAKRNEARANKDYATADEIRDHLKEAGIILEDDKSGTQWLRQ